MRKQNIFILTILLSLWLQAYTVALAEPTKIHFVYIHGTAQNDKKSKNKFFEASNTLHSHIKKELEASPIIKSNFLDNGNLVIANTSIPYYWGDKPIIEGLSSNVELTNKGFSFNLNKFAGGEFRKLIATVLHDAAWFVQEGNKHLVLTELAKEIKANTEDSSHIVLLGHSAGSLVTFEFLKFRLPYFDEEALRAADIPLKLQTNSQTSCLQALLSSGLVIYSHNGKLALVKSNEEDLKGKLSMLNEYTIGLCLPDGKLKGVVTFGSPIAVFLSSIEQKGSIDHYLAKKMLEYIYNNNSFWLHVNHRDDPIAVAFSESDIKKILAYDLIKNKNSKSLIVNNNSYGKGATFIGAHDWYWNKPDDFARLLSQVYENGYDRWVKKN